MPMGMGMEGEVIPDLEWGITPGLVEQVSGRRWDAQTACCPSRDLQP